MADDRPSTNLSDGVLVQVRASLFAAPLVQVVPQLFPFFGIEQALRLLVVEIVLCLLDGGADRELLPVGLRLLRLLRLGRLEVLALLLGVDPLHLAVDLAFVAVLRAVRPFVGRLAAGAGWEAVVSRPAPDLSLGRAVVLADLQRRTTAAGRRADVALGAAGRGRLRGPDHAPLPPPPGASAAGEPSAARWLAATAAGLRLDKAVDPERALLEARAFVR